MKAKEVMQMSDEKLFESVDKNNNTGFLTEDVVKIIRQHESGSWSKGYTAEEFDAYLNEVCGK